MLVSISESFILTSLLQFDDCVSLSTRLAVKIVVAPAFLHPSRITSTDPTL